MTGALPLVMREGASPAVTTPRRKENTMKKIIACICIALAAFAAGHLATIYTLEIETDGDGDSAIVTVFGQEHFYGINGYEIG